MTIGGETVSVWPPLGTSPDEALPAEAGFGAIFDSTHFAHGRSLEVKVEVWTINGDHGTQSYTVPVYNKAVTYGRAEFEGRGGDYAGVPPSLAALAAINHDVSATAVNQGWMAGQFLGALATGTALYINTHGRAGDDQVTSIADGTGTSEANAFYVFASSSTSNPPTVLSTRRAAVGTGSPPFQSGIPTMNVAFVDGCRTGQNDGLSRALLWPTNPMMAVDQASCGWKISALQTASKGCSEKFWTTLQQGYTVGETREPVMKAYNDAFHAAFPNYPPSFKWPPDSFVIWGDQFTRLHSVFTGNANPPSRWYR